MKIVMVSMFANHFFNWTEQLKDSGHEIYWLDVFDSNTKVQKIDFVEQIIGWRYRWNFPGRYFLKSKAPKITKFINTVNERDMTAVFEEKLQEIQPDVVHSFVMFQSCVPVFEVMQKYSDIKWIYSSWGSDLFYYQNIKNELQKIKQVLPRINYIFSDCKRDYIIAVENGFSGKFLGVFPGGGGFDLEKTDPLLHEFSERDIILIKGYQGKHGRCNCILEALLDLREELKTYEIVVFGANEEVKRYTSQSALSNWKNVRVLEKISHIEVMKLMGKAIIYIGNSLSDGMPNTLLEAIFMGAFPVQSNPGGATAELIENGKNGLLIENSENVDEIRNSILNAINNKEKLKQGIDYNLRKIKPKLEREFIRQQVLEKYNSIERDL